MSYTAFKKKNKKKKQQDSPFCHMINLCPFSDWKGLVSFIFHTTLLKYITLSTLVHIIVPVIETCKCSSSFPNTNLIFFFVLFMQWESFYNNNHLPLWNWNWVWWDTGNCRDLWRVTDSQNCCSADSNTGFPCTRGVDIWVIFTSDRAAICADTDCN